MKKLAIVGTHPETRELAPWEDAEYEIWVFNESPQAGWCRRWDASFQLHKVEVYTSPNNHVRGDHWDWLQDEHPEKTIWMQEVDERVPGSRRFPLDEVLAAVPGGEWRWLDSSIAFAIALAIYQGYEEVALYGLDMHSDTEYGYQLRNYQYWVGVMVGAGIKVDNQCNQAYFSGRLYGYEGEIQIDRSVFAARAEELDRLWNDAEKHLKRQQERLQELMLEHKYEKVPAGVVAYQEAALAAGELAGALQEAVNYAKREDLIPRLEFERHSATAQREGEDFRARMYNTAGKAEYVWMAWKALGTMEALQQLRMFVGQQGQHAYDTGARLGIHRENQRYLKDLDLRIQAAGGMRSVKAIAAK